MTSINWKQHTTQLVKNKTVQKFFLWTMDESFKRPGSVPFQWEIKPGIPKPYYQSQSQSKMSHVLSDLGVSVGGIDGVKPTSGEENKRVTEEKETASTHINYQQRLSSGDQTHSVSKGVTLIIKPVSIELSEGPQTVAELEKHGTDELEKKRSRIQNRSVGLEVVVSSVIS